MNSKDRFLCVPNIPIKFRSDSVGRLVDTVVVHFDPPRGALDCFGLEMKNAATLARSEAEHSAIFRKLIARPAFEPVVIGEHRAFQSPLTEEVLKKIAGRLGIKNARIAQQRMRTSPRLRTH